MSETRDLRLDRLEANFQDIKAVLGRLEPLIIRIDERLNSTLPQPRSGPSSGAKKCVRQTEPDPADQAARYGADTAVRDWRKRLVCSACREP